MPVVFSRFSGAVQDASLAAELEAQTRGRAAKDAGHVLWGLATVRPPRALAVLARPGVPVEALLSAAEKALEGNEVGPVDLAREFLPPAERPSFGPSEEAGWALRRALEAARAGVGWVRSDDVLFGLMEEPYSAGPALRALGLTAESVRAASAAVEEDEPERPFPAPSGFDGELARGAEEAGLLLQGFRFAGAPPGDPIHIEVRFWNPDRMAVRQDVLAAAFRRAAARVRRTLHGAPVFTDAGMDGAAPCFVMTGELR